MLMNPRHLKLQTFEKKIDVHHRVTYYIPPPDCGRRERCLSDDILKTLSDQSIINAKIA